MHAFSPSNTTRPARPHSRTPHSSRQACTPSALPVSRVPHVHTLEPHTVPDRRALLRPLQPLQ
eukprot:363518-Chlamydomonas_euryale.AAC.5